MAAREPARTRRWMRRSLLLALLLVATLLSAWSTRASWLAPRIERELEQALSEATGARVELQGISGGYLGDLELSGLSLVDERAQASLVRLDVGRARLRYSLLAFLLDAPDALDRCRLELDGVRALVVLDAAQADSEREDGSASWDLPERWPELVARDVTLEALHEDRRLVLEGLELQTSDVEGGQDLELRARTCRWSVGAEDQQASELGAHLSWRRPRLELDSLVLGSRELVQRASLALGTTPADELRFELQATPFEGALELSGSSRPEGLELSFEARDLDLAQALELWTPGADGNGARVLSLSGQLAMDPRTGELERCSLAGSARDVRAFGRELDELDVELAVEGRSLLAKRVSARRGEESAVLRGLSLPLGESTFETLRAARGELEFVLDDLPRWIDGDSAPSATPGHRLQLAARLTDQGLVVDGGELSTAGGHFRLQPGSIRPGEGDELIDGAWIDLGFDVDFRELASLGDVLASDATWGGSLRGDLHLIGTLGSLTGRFDLAGSDVVARGVEFGDLRALASLDAQRLEIETLRSQGEWLELDVSGGWDLASNQADELDLVVSTQHLETLFPGAFSEGDLRVEGRLSGSLFDPRGAVSASAGLLRLAARPEQAFENAQLSGAFEEGRLRVDSLVCRIENVDVETRGAFGHNAWLLPYAVEFEELDLRRGPLDLVLLRPTRALFAAGSTLIEESSLRGSAGELVFDLEQYGNAWSVSALGVDLDPMPLLEPLTPRGFLVSGVNGEFVLEFDGDRLALDAGLRVERLRPAAGVPELALDTRAHLGEGELVLERLNIDMGAVGGLELSGRAPLEPRAAQPLGDGSLELQGSADLRDLAALPGLQEILEYELTGAARTHFRLEGSWDEVRGRFDLESEDLALMSRRGGGTAVFGPARVALDLDLGERIHVRELSLGSPNQLGFEGSGELGSSLDLRRWLAEGPAYLTGAPLALRGDVRAEDVGFLARRLGMRRMAGQVEGEFALSGSLQQPLPEGSLRLSSGELRLEGDFPAIDGLRARVVVEPGRTRVQELFGELGGGAVEGSGEVDWSEDGLRLDLKLIGREALLVQRPSLRVRADADLRLQGPLEALLLSGSLSVRDGRYTRDVQFLGGGPAQPGAEAGVRLFSFEEGALSKLRFDVDVGSSEPFRIQNNLVRGSTRLALKLGGTGRVPELLGSVFVDPSQVALPAALLRTTSGTIRFERDDPLVPQLDVRMETRVRGYDITVRVIGPSDEPEVELTSVPPLASEDALLLMLTGKPPESAWSSDTGSAAAQTVAVFVGKDLLGRWFEDEWSDEESWLDRIEWSSGEDVTQSGGQTSELAIRILGDARGAGRTVWLRAENDVYDRNNFGIRFVLRRD